MSKSITLNDGSAALVDDADFAVLSAFRWMRLGHTSASCKTSYACRTIMLPEGRRVMLLHREILGAKSGQEVDHINGNGLDNRRRNLRFVTSSQNHVARDRKKPLSGFKGVQQHPRTPHRFRASITIGTYASAEEAARAYDDIAAILWGEFARPNFPAIAADATTNDNEEAA